MRPIYTVLNILAILFSIHLSGQTLTYGDVFDFEVGDIFHYKNSDIYGPQDSEGPPNYTHIKITQKWFSNNGDTIFYEKTWKTVYVAFCQSCTPDPTEYGVDTVFYSGLSDIISAGPIPIWDTNNCMTNWSNYTGNYIDTTFNYSPQFFNLPSVIKIHEWGDSCKYFFPFQFDYELEVFSKGLGIALYKYDHCTSGNEEHDCYYDIRLVYFRNSQTSGGTPVDLLNSIPALNPDSDLRLFPNPINNDLTIETNGTIISRLIMYDVLGNEVLRTQPKSPGLKMNLQDFETGIYIISISQNNLPPTYHRVVKQ